MEEKLELYMQKINETQEETYRFWTLLDDGYQVVIFLKPLWRDRRYTMYKTNEFFRDSLASYLERQDQRIPGFNGQAITFTLQLMKSPHLTNEKI